MVKEFLLDKQQVRRSFARAANTYDKVAVLQREVSNRMLERLDYIKYAPSSILDAGSGTGGSIAALKNRYPGAQLIELDIAAEMLARSRQARSLQTLQICGDIETLPIADESIDLIWSNLSLQWINDLSFAFSEMSRILRVGGLLMFTTFGVDTLKELRWCFSQLDAYTHVNRFSDMHDIGDLLLRSQFETPVVDVEHIALTYPDLSRLLADLKALGAHNSTQGRRHSLTGKSRMTTLAAYYEKFRKENVLPATFEVIYGHAWKTSKKPLRSDSQPIRMYPKQNG